MRSIFEPSFSTFLINACGIEFKHLLKLNFQLIKCFGLWPNAILFCATPHKHNNCTNPQVCKIRASCRPKLRSSSTYTMSVRSAIVNFSPIIYPQSIIQNILCINNGISWPLITAFCNLDQSLLFPLSYKNQTGRDFSIINYHNTDNVKGGCFKQFKINLKNYLGQNACYIIR